MSNNAKIMSRLYDIRQSKLLKSSLWLVVLQVFNTVIPLATIPYITRVLGASGYGTFSLSLNWVVYFLVIVEYGFGFLGARKVAMLSVDELHKTYSDIITSRMLLLVISFALMTSIYLLSGMDKSHYIAMVILFCMVLGSAFQLTWLFQGMQDMKTITLINATSRVLSVVLIFLLVKSEKDVYLYCFLYSCTFLFSSFIGVKIAKKKYGLKVKLGKLSDVYPAMSEGWPLFVSQAMAKVLSGFGVTVLGVVSSGAIVGVYSAIYKIPFIMTMFFSPISQALYPISSVEFSKSQELGVKKVRMVALAVMPFFFICGMLIIIFREWIVELAFGVDYTQYSIIVVPLTIWFFISILNNFLGIQILVASGHQSEYSRAFFYGAITAILLNIALGYSYGIYGVAIATCLSEFILMVILLLEVFKLKNSRRKESLLVS